MRIEGDEEEASEDEEEEDDDDELVVAGEEEETVVAQVELARALRSKPFLSVLLRKEGGAGVVD
jgi:hypothetical protein